MALLHHIVPVHILLTVCLLEEELFGPFSYTTLTRIMTNVHQLFSRFVRNAAVLQSSRVAAPRLFATEAASLNEKFDKLVKNNKVVVFMKGVPEQPMCGFSNAVVQIMRMHGVEYDSHNVLADETVRQGLNILFV